MPEQRHQPAALIELAANLLTAAGLAGDRARLMAGLLVEADLMGHTTHGLALLPAYLDELAAGTMTASGEPEVIRDTGPCLTWDGRRLPGVWLTAHAIDTAVPRARQYGTATVVVRRSHHIACLGAFLTRATDHGLMVLLASSDPSVCSVAPYGGITPVFTPDPIAIGIPTTGEPILIDTSASITTNGMSARLRAEGRRFPHAWLLDAAGAPSDDPNVLFAEPAGTILPTGGLDHGHKGYGLALMIEALSQGLAGHGRKDAPARWGGNVFLQVIDPDLFAGADAFAAQTDFFTERCRANRPVNPKQPVRIPGDAAARGIDQAEAEGIRYDPATAAALRDCAARLNVPLPTGLQAD